MLHCSNFLLFVGSILLICTIRHMWQRTKKLRAECESWRTQCYTAIRLHDSYKAGQELILPEIYYQITGSKLRHTTFSGDLLKLRVEHPMIIEEICLFSGTQTIHRIKLRTPIHARTSDVIDLDIDTNHEWVTYIGPKPKPSGQICPTCNGQGIPLRGCPTCHKIGSNASDNPTTCPACAGLGPKEGNEPCPLCKTLPRKEHVS
jgi:hypothetical protein